MSEDVERLQVTVKVKEAITCPHCHHKDRGGPIGNMPMKLLGLTCPNCQNTFNVDIRDDEQD